MDFFFVGNFFLPSLSSIYAPSFHSCSHFRVTFTVDRDQQTLSLSTLIPSSFLLCIFPPTQSFEPLLWSFPFLNHSSSFSDGTTHRTPSLFFASSFFPLTQVRTSAAPFVKMMNGSLLCLSLCLRLLPTLIHLPLLSFLMRSFKLDLPDASVEDGSFSA